MTEYRGRRYRSRLDARWAAFFDQMGWKHEYDPIDFAAWSPEFLLCDFQMLVVVRPVAQFPDTLGDRLEEALGASPDKVTEDPPLELLLVGLCPGLGGDASNVGWWHCRQSGWHQAQIEWVSENLGGGQLPDIVKKFEDGWIAASGQRNAFGRDNPGTPIGRPDILVEKWKAAANATPRLCGQRP